MTAKTPPATATSSPKKMTRSSAASSSSSASRTAVRKAIVAIRAARRERLLEQLAECGTGTGAVGAVDDAVVAAQRQRQHVAEDDAAGAVLDGLAPTPPTARIAACGGSTIAVKERDAEHAEVRDRERAVRAAPRARSARRARASASRPRLGRDLGERLPVGVDDAGTSSASLGRDRDADVDARQRSTPPSTQDALKRGKLAQRRARRP